MNGHIPNKVDVIICGGGPVGLLVALGLGKAGVSTLVLESHGSILPLTRAMVYMPVVIPVLKKLGIYDAVERTAVLNKEGVVWRNVEGEALAQLPLHGSDPDEFGGVLLLGQAKLSGIILEELKSYPSVEVRFGQRVVGIEDPSDSETVKVMIRSRETYLDQTLEARYVLGADGANSTVRGMMCIPFEGFTYQDFKLIGCDVICDFQKEMGFTPLNFTVDPDDFAVIAYSGEDEHGKSLGSGRPLWRVAYPESPGLSEHREEVMQRAIERIPRYIKGSQNFTIARAEAYILHQRCAKTGRKGRVLLAGDALHSNNPMGGLGLTSGILDAFAYGNALVRVIKGAEPDSLLTECSESRRNAWIESTNTLSQANLKRLYGFDEETVAARNGFFHKLKTDETFPKMVRAGFDRMMPKSFEVSLS